MRSVTALSADNRVSGSKYTERALWLASGSLGAATLVGELRDGQVSEYEIHPEDFGIAMAASRNLRVDDPAQSRAMLLGGEPFESPIVMWWNFVGRSREEIAVAYKDWDGGTDRFGRVASPLARIPVEAPSWLVAG